MLSVDGTILPKHGAFGWWSTYYVHGSTWSNQFTRCFPSTAFQERHCSTFRFWDVYSFLQLALDKAQKTILLFVLLISCILLLFIG